MFDRELLHNTLSIQSTSGDTERMKRYIKRFARRLGGDITIHEEHDNIYITKGKADIYPCVVAHTDTVHDIVSSFIVNHRDGVYSAKNRDTGAQVGVGGDDKVGIAVALHALREYDTLKVAFFADEEIGCVGSSKADMVFFEDCAFAIQCDRKGSDDVVHSVYGTSLYDHTFSTAIRPFLNRWKFQETTGMLTDVYALRKRGLPIASLNMSAGYYHPHMSFEIVRLDDVNKTWGFVADVIEQLGHQQWISSRYVQSPFSLFEDKEEDEEEDVSFFDDDDVIYMHPWVGGGHHLDECPTCRGNDIAYDDTVGADFCMVCLDYIFVEDAEELEVV